MTEGKEQKSLSNQLARRLLPVSLGIAFMISVIVPTVYYSIETKRVKNEATTYAEMFAESIKKLAAESPSLWKYQATKYAQILDSFLPDKNIVSILILDEKQKRITGF